MDELDTEDAGSLGDDDAGSLADGDAAAAPYKRGA